MFRFLTTLFIAIMVVPSVLAQQNNDVLITIDADPVYALEFKRVYKKNLDLVQDESQRNVENYLNLFIDYKLKLAEAYAQNLDEDSNYVKEFSQYEEQLSRNYLYEDKLTDELVLEAYNRGLEEVDASHILILTTYDDLPQDTLKAYNKIEKIRIRALAGEDFTTLAKEFSEEPSAKEHGGALGYNTVFSLVYPFETEMYNTKVGEVSNIVRTQFGYHIIKVNDRRNREAEILVSHIMISDKVDSTRTFNPAERINEIYALLQQGESFESLAKQFSDDKNSGKNGGQLGKFSRGDLRSVEFENAAYNLKNVGDISKPFKSNFGWHIIRLDEVFTLPSFEDKKENILKRVQEPTRSKVVTHKVNKLIKEKYGMTINQNYREFFDGLLTDDVLQRKWVYDTIAPAENKTLFTIGDHSLKYSDFAEYISARQRRSQIYKSKESLITGMFDEFETLELKKYFRTRLEYENEEYAGLISEYREGLLIFDVMEKNIWSKAKNDSIGLQKYYEATKDQYSWKERIDAMTISTTSRSVAEQLRDLLNQGRTENEIREQFNTDEKVNVIISKGVFEKGSRGLPPSFEFTEGVSNIFDMDDSFVVIKTTAVIPPSPKTLDEVRGKVMSNYQDYLEKNWMESLHKKFEVEVNQRTLKKVVKELKI